MIDWVMKAEGISFRHAVELLRAEHPVVARKLEPVVKIARCASCRRPSTAMPTTRDAA